MAESDTRGEWALPNGWVWTTLGKVTEPSKEKVNPQKIQRTPYVGLEHIEKDTGKLLGFGYSDEVRSTKAVFHRGDLLYGKLRPYLNKVHIADFDGICSTDILVFPGNPYVSNKYLLYRLLSGDFVRYANLNISGVQHPRTNFKILSQFPLALPPTAEQRRSVAEIETQFTRLDAGVAALERAQANLKRYRASVLKVACEGRLVPTEAELARAEGRAYESADQLLARILAKRRAKWEAENPGKKYKEPEPVNTEAPLELPEGWIWTNIDSLFTVSIGGTPSRKEPKYWNGGIHWVSSGEVAFCRIKDTREKITASGLANSSAKLNPPGTVLLAMIGEGKTRGQAAILDVPAANNQNAASLLCSETPILPEWVFYWFMARYEQTRTGGVASGGMQPALNSRKVRALPITIPPLPEQRRIVAEVERRLSVVEALEREVEAALARAARLRQSILKRAFEGRLVPQDPDDEPASALLERIRAEREAPTREKGRRAEQLPLPGT